MKSAFIILRYLHQSSDVMLECLSPRSRIQFWPISKKTKAATLSANTTPPSSIMFLLVDQVGVEPTYLHDLITSKFPLIFLSAYNNSVCIPTTLWTSAFRKSYYITYIQPFEEFKVLIVITYKFCVDHLLPGFKMIYHVLNNVCPTSWSILLPNSNSRIPYTIIRIYVFRCTPSPTTIIRR